MEADKMTELIISTVVFLLSLGVGAYIIIDDGEGRWPVWFFGIIAIFPVLWSRLRGF
jgi:hypothetical protein